MLHEVGLLIPIFLAIALLEWLITRKIRNGQFTFQNTAINLTIGAIDQSANLFSGILFYLYLKLIYDNVAFFHLQQNWWQWILAYIAIDFVSYWYHRWSHEINILWAGHITHHSSDHFNYTNGFRTSPLQGINRIPFWTILPLMGFSPYILLVTFKISGIYDFIQHTQNIPKLGFLEKILITPSLHRVHHGKNDIYIDKNYGSSFVIWDKLFGTFQEETIPVVYGIKMEEYKDDDPVKAVTYYYQYLAKLIKATKSWKNKILILFKRPGWLPPDTYAVVSSQQNNAKISVQLKRYAFINLLINSILFTTTVLFKNYLSTWEFLTIIALIIGGMEVSARIINNKLGGSFWLKENVRIGISIIGIAVLYYFHPFWYLATVESVFFIGLLPTIYLQRNLELQQV